MDLSKRYKDSSDNPRNILEMVEREPDWAANRLQAGERAIAALEKINAIRNSIVGTQTVNWSAHVYPLVAAINEAGFEGQGYEEARKEAVTLIDQRDKAEKENSEMKELLRDIYRVCGASSRASHREQTEIFQRLRKALGIPGVSV